MAKRDKFRLTSAKHFQATTRTACFSLHTDLPKNTPIIIENRNWEIGWRSVRDTASSKPTCGGRGNDCGDQACARVMHGPLRSFIPSAANFRFPALSGPFSRAQRMATCGTWGHNRERPAWRRKEAFRASAELQVYGHSDGLLQVLQGSIPKSVEPLSLDALRLSGKNSVLIKTLR